MKKLFCLEDSIQNKISFYHLLLFLVFLPFDRFYSTVVLLSFLIHTIICLQRSQWSKMNRDVLMLQSVFFVTLFSSIWAVSFAASMNVASKQLAIFLFPLLLSAGNLNLVKYRSLLLKGFAVACTFTILYLFYDAFRVIRYEHFPLKALFSGVFVHHNFSLPINVHATYLSMYVVISLVYFIKTSIDSRDKNERLWMIACSVILAAGLLQLASKSVLLAAFIIFNICLPLMLVRHRARYFAFSLSVSSILLICIFSTSVFRERFLEDFKNELVSTKMAEENWRIDRWKASIDLIQESPVIGKGSGSETPLLKEIYFERKMYIPFLFSMNVHNQFLSFLITSGIIGLLVYLGTLFWGFWRAVKAKDLLLLSLMVLISIVSVSEDMLDVNKGIFFYAFFFSFFILSQNRRKQATIQL